ncbi:MAG: EamA family transporter, partial [Hyphomicrobiales bacterium]
HLNTVLAATVVGLVLLSVWMLAGGYALTPHWPSLWLVALSGVGSALATMWLFAALAIGPISVVSPIAASYPALSVGYAFAMGSRPSALEWLAMAGVMAGVLVVSRATSGASDAARAERDNIARVVPLALMSSLAFAVSLTAGQAAAPIYGEVQTTWFARLFGAAVLLMFFARGTERFDMPLRWWPVFVAMGLLDILGMVTIVAAGHLPQAEIAQVTGSTFGVITVLLGRFLLKEQISRVRWGGIALIFSGVAVLSAHG